MPRGPKSGYVIQKCGLRYICHNCLNVSIEMFFHQNSAGDGFFTYRHNVMTEWYIFRIHMLFCNFFRMDGLWSIELNILKTFVNFKLKPKQTLEIPVRCELSNEKHRFLWLKDKSLYFYIIFQYFSCVVFCCSLFVLVVVHSLVLVVVVVRYCYNLF